MAEREGFEPPVPCDTLDFESSTLDHSDISPGLLWVRFYQIDRFPSSRISLQAYPPVSFGKPDRPRAKLPYGQPVRAVSFRVLAHAMLPLRGMAIMRTPRAPWCGLVVVRLGGRARYPHRAAAPSARCVAWHRAEFPVCTARAAWR